MTDPHSDPLLSYDLDETRPPTPDLPGRVVVANTVEELLEQMSRDLLAHSLNCARQFGDFHFATSGDASLVPFYRHLMIDPICRGIPWKKTHLWMVEERRTGGESPSASQWQTIRELLGDHAGIPPSQQHPMPTDRWRVDEIYESSIRSALEWRERGHDRLDFVMLHVGDHGQAGRLYPLSAALHEQDRLLTITRGDPDEPDVEWVTMTYPILNAARFVAVMLTGERRRPLVEKLMGNGHRPDVMPIAGVRPRGGVLSWYLDRAACPGISQTV